MCSLFTRKPVPHMRDINGKRVIAMPEEHLKVWVEVQGDVMTYIERGLEVVLQRGLMRKSDRELEIH